MPLGVLTSNWPVVLGLLLVGLLVYWLVDEWGEASGSADRVERVGKRADSFTGEFLGAVGALVFSVSMIVMTVGQQLVETLGMLEPLVSTAPVVIGHLIIGALAWASLEGVLGLSARGFGYAFILVTVVALFLKYGREGSSAN